MDLYERIDASLKSIGSNRKEMAQKLNISYATISSLFARHSKGMNLDMLQKIADYLNVTMDYLIYGEEKEKPAKKFASLKLELALNEVGLKLSDLENLDDAQTKLAAALIESFLQNKSKN